MSRFRKAAKRLVPPRYRDVVREAGRRSVRRLRHFGLNRYCPVCRSQVRAFLAAGVKSRPDARCPVCGSFERHRLIWLYLRHCTELFDGRTKTFLHVAPEKLLSDRLRSKSSIRYVSIDLTSPRSLLRMDLTRLAFADDQFDFVYCSHVLEHIEDDGMAMAELHRVTKAGGRVIVLVPIRGDVTREDRSITDPDERERVFGQRDHVRIYGTDVKERLEAAGFLVEADRYASSLPERQSRSWGLDRNDTIFVCRKHTSVPVAGSAG